MADFAVAQQTGHPVQSVRQLRWALGIACKDPKNRSWTGDEDALLGVLSDQEVAQRLGRTFAAVRARRIHSGKRDPSARSLWKPEEDRLLGTASDTEIAKQLNRTCGAVKSRRKQLGIAAAAQS